MKSKQWFRRHITDPYVKKARMEGYRSRAAYKLLEIQEKDFILKEGMMVVDLGAAPGGWLEVALNYIGSSGKILALDRLPFKPISGVKIIEGDFTEIEVVEKVLDMLEGHSVDLVMSDMAPNITGIASVDIPKMMNLAELALDFSKKVLRVNGSFLVKVFQGAGFTEFMKILRQHFREVKVRKPKSSRNDSKEVYLLAKGFLG